MFRLIFTAVYIILYLISTVFVSAKASHLLKKGNIKGYDALVDRCVRNFSRAVLRCAGAEVRISGLEHLPEGAAVYVSNHQSDFDAMVILGYIGKTKSFFAKKEMIKIPILSSWMRHMRCVFVDRGSHAAASRAIRDAVELLKSGYPMVIFPEGTRSRTGTMGEFKYGAFKMSDASGVPVVPIRIDGTRDLFENNRFALKKGIVTATVLPPVDVASLPPQQKPEIHRIVRDMIASAEASSTL